jgi:hypothetical protein
MTLIDQAIFYKMFNNAVILRAFLLEGSLCMHLEILRYAQDDKFVNTAQKWPMSSH